MSPGSYQPVDSGSVPRYAGVPTFMRLPMARPSEVDIALVGVPFDGGTTNRAGTRHGPREIRNQSSLMRRVHHATGVSPYDGLRVGDCGDAPVNPVDLMDSLARIESFYADIHRAGAVPISAGGDHLISLPILRGIATGGPVGMIQFDAHSDTYDTFFSDNRYTHGTHFRRAIEEGHLDPKRVVQIGLRGAISDASNYDYAREVGVRMIFIEELVSRGIEDVMAEALDLVGSKPTYVSFDIDIIDPSMAPGTGTPEIGGVTTREAQAMVRRLRGVDIIGADVVEVAPPFDLTGLTALVGATMMFELLCVVAEGAGSRLSGSRPQGARP